ncbi:MAG: hypothetical protein GXP13_03340 [Gammaproteobacteria bacterium]|nr:hypothetical protein [Gammaproteobacteria bacterium]
MIYDVSRDDFVYDGTLVRYGYLNKTNLTQNEALIGKSKALFLDELKRLIPVSMYTVLKDVSIIRTEK